ncbi:MAG TPA: sulfite exporter TauE/SafE family protein [Polyangiaceae bacterium]|nr:sulfite exporter TauE/SafE family protein [Polyangiaceae bacterium]
MDYASLIAANLIIAVGAWVQGSVGFGLALIAAPLLAIISPSAVPGPLLATTFALIVLTVWRERQAIDVRGIGWVLAGRVPGAAVGALTLAAMNPRALGLTLGALTLLAVVLTATKLRIERKPLALFVAGTVSGFMGTTSAIGGPAVAILYQHDEGRTVRASLAAYFTIGCLMSMTALSLVHRFGVSDLHQGVLMLPGVAIGFALSAKAGAFLDKGRTRTAVLVVAGLSGIGAMLRAALLP